MAPPAHAPPARPRAATGGLPSPAPKVHVVRRDEVPSIHSVEVDGRTYHLGILKNLRKHEVLGRFIPDRARPSIGWVALKPDETLETHRHPVASLIVITRGQGRLLSQGATDVREGDMICVPPGAPHGFVGAGEDGFWGLSLQFEDRGLYEDLADPLVDFGAVAESDMFGVKLKARNESLFDHFMRQPIFMAFADGTYNDPARRARLVAALQVWSNHFHKMLLLRSATCEEGAALRVFDAHLEDEFTHADDLAKERSDLTPAWDAALHAACAWFVNKMMNLDTVEKVVLVHMVTERAATGFYGAAQDVLADEAGRHIAAHAEHDCEHAAMGEDLIDNLDHRTFQRLCSVQQQGWSMLEVVLARCHALGMGAAESAAIRARPRAVGAG